MTSPQEREIDRLAQRVADLYAQAELLIAQRIAKALAAGIDAPDWAQAKMLELQLVQARIRGELNALAAKALGEIAITIAKMRNLGNATAIAQLDLYGITATALQTTIGGTERQVRALLAETAQDVLGQHARILRSVDDVYRAAVQQAVGIQLTGAATRREMAQQALNEMASRGLTGFIDSSGRHWSLTAYTEMSMRTAARRAQVIGTSERLQAEGFDLVQVSDHAQECPLCAPWENQVLSLSGATSGTIQIDGTRVGGTLEQAMGDGLFHPNCRHAITLYVPGVSRPPVGASDPAGYAARQEQRRLERGIREWKRREVVALDPATAARARTKVRDWQAKLREHLAAHPELKRQSDRESIGVANSLSLPGFTKPETTVTPIRGGAGGGSLSERLHNPLERERWGAVDVPDGMWPKPEPHELDTAHRLARFGYDVQLRQVSNIEGAKNPDILMDGHVWEMKAPEGSGKNTISHQLARARKQGRMMVLDTGRTALADDEILAEVRRRFALDYKLDEILVVFKDGTGIRISR